MSARDVIAQLVGNTFGSGDEFAEELLGVLRGHGYAVVELPEPDSERYEGDEHEPQDRKSWVINDVFDVMVWNRLEVQVAEGIGLGWETREPLSAEIARQLGTALLAAAAAAESL